MNASTARHRLYIMTAAESEPKLSADELDMLVEMARRADADGFAPADTGWVPTYDLNSAAAEGWRWKAAKAAMPNFRMGDQSIDSMIDQCERMAQTYASRVIATVAMI